MKQELLNIKEILNTFTTHESKDEMISNSFELFKKFEQELSCLNVDDISHIEKLLETNRRVAKTYSSSLLMSLNTLLEERINKLLVLSGNELELEPDSMLFLLNKLSKISNERQSVEKTIKKQTRKIVERHDDAKYEAGEIFSKTEKMMLDLIPFIKDSLRAINKKIEKNEFGGTDYENKKIIEDVIQALTDTKTEVSDTINLAESTYEALKSQTYQQEAVKEEKESELQKLNEEYDEQYTIIKNKMAEYEKENIVIGIVKEEKLKDFECRVLYAALKKGGIEIQRFSETSKSKKNRKEEIITKKINNTPIIGELLNGKYGIFVINPDDFANVKSINSDSFAKRISDGSSILRMLISKFVHIENKYNLNINNKKVLHTYDEYFKEKQKN